MPVPQRFQDEPSAMLLAQAAAGNAASLGQLLDLHRDRLRRMILTRMDRRLRGRIDPSDVIQEAQLEAARRLPEYLRKPDVPFFVWLRFLCNQRLLALGRHHLGAQLRSAGREISIDQAASGATSAALAARLLGRLTRPSEAAIRAELKRQLRQALDQLEPIDKEILTLRHLEQLSTAETAAALGIQEEAAKKRHLRALRRLQAVLTGPTSVGESSP